MGPVILGLLHPEFVPVAVAIKRKTTQPEKPEKKKKKTTTTTTTTKTKTKERRSPRRWRFKNRRRLLLLFFFFLFFLFFSSFNGDDIPMGFLCFFFFFRKFWGQRLDFLVGLLIGLCQKLINRKMGLFGPSKENIKGEKGVFSLIDCSPCDPSHRRCIDMVPFTSAVRLDRLSWDVMVG